MEHLVVHCSFNESSTNKYVLTFLQMKNYPAAIQVLKCPTRQERVFEIPLEPKLCFSWGIIPFTKNNWNGMYDSRYTGGSSILPVVPAE